MSPNELVGACGRSRDSAKVTQHGAALTYASARLQDDKDRLKSIAHAHVSQLGDPVSQPFWMKHMGSSLKVN